MNVIGMEKNPFFLALLAFAALAGAATVKGTVFDSNLDPASAIISINTTPTQTMAAKNGSFSFQVPVGLFALTARAGNYSISETVQVVHDGVFNIDLVLFGFEVPSLEVPIVPGETGFEGQETTVPTNGDMQQQFPWLWVLIPALAVLALVFLVFSKWSGLQKQAKEIQAGAGAEKEIEEKRMEEPQRQPKHAGAEKHGGLSEFQKKILEEIKKSEGRMSQRELRRLLPWSEAKVSIELDLLEEKGLIKKFKKGRGNIVILAEKTKAK